MKEYDKWSVVSNFISNFKGSEDTFLHGCCYWFANILKTRFDDDGFLVDIYHEPVEGHFIAGFVPVKTDENTVDEERFFDIRGDVTSQYQNQYLESMWLMWLDDRKRYKKLMNDCRDFLPPDVE